MGESDKIKKRLDSVGCGFCLAKWTQVTMHLHNGLTHSCHHPTPHKIPLKEIEKNPTALHNTEHKKKIRKEMLDGLRPKECSYCWGIEETSISHSDRVFKSAEPWSLPHIKEIKNIDWDENYTPRYVEVSFSNVCNFKCIYCSPQFSSKWVEEIKKFGAYPTTTNYNNLDWLKQTNQLPYRHGEKNPYVDSFWMWWPELFKTLHTFRITGGEPLLSDDVFKTLEYIQKNYKENPNISLGVNTNLGVSKQKLDKFLDIANDLTENNKVRELIIFTSIESSDKQAEYIRHGLKYDVFIQNISEALTRLPKITVNIMATFNALSVFGYDKLIDDVFELKRKHKNGLRYWTSAVQLDTSYLTWPEHLSVKILSDDDKKRILKSAEKMLYYGIKEFNHNNHGFSNIEIQKLKRTYDYSLNTGGFDLVRNKKDFISFIDECDSRRDSKFLDVFPQLIDFYVENKKR
jgi:organic radical activating enzyme